MATKCTLLVLLALAIIGTNASPIQLDSTVVRQNAENQKTTSATPNHNGGDDLGDDGPGDDSPAAIAAKKRAKELKQKAKRARKNGLSNEEKARLSGNIHSFGNGNSDDKGEGEGKKGSADSGEDKFGNDIGENQSDNTSAPANGSGATNARDDNADDGKEKGDDGKEKGDDGKEKDDDGKEKGDDSTEQGSDARGGEDSGSESDVDGSGNADNDIGVGQGTSDGAKAGSKSQQAACFPAGSLVTLKSGEKVKMASLEIGDEVSVGNGQFSEVFMFTHRLPTRQAEFVQVTTESDVLLRLTAGHFLSVNGVFSPASVIRSGDKVVLENGYSSRVTSVELVAGVGLFSPQTTHGHIVVDGVLVSTYTNAVQPKAAHALLAPFRAVFARFGLAATFLDSGSDSLAHAAHCIFA